MRITIFGIFLYMMREWDDMTIEVTHKALDDKWFSLMVIGLIFCALMDISDLLINIKEFMSRGPTASKTNN